MRVRRFPVPARRQLLACLLVASLFLVGLQFERFIPLMPRTGGHVGANGADSTRRGN